MKVRNTGTRRRHQRSARGAAIIGGVSMLILISLLGMGMIQLLLYWATLSNDLQQLTSIGTEAARQVVNAKCNYGMEMQDGLWDKAGAEDAATDAVEEQVGMLGYKLQGRINFTYRRGVIHRHSTSDNPNANDIPVVEAIAEFDVTPSGSAPINKRIFGLVPQHISTVSSDSEEAIRRHGMATIVFQDPDNPANRRGIRVPIYNYTRLNGMASRPNMFKGGKSVGRFPSANLTIWAKNSPSFARDKSRRKDNPV